MAGWMAVSMVGWMDIDSAVRSDDLTACTRVVATVEMSVVSMADEMA